ncbi:MAG: extracellular solute-binding protein [Bacteriovoracaceae bacterium]
MRRWLTLLSLLTLIACSKKDNRKEVWIYTSLYKDTIADMTPKLEKAFPEVKVNWYQAGSEEIAAKVNTELMAGEPKADILLSSERFWYQELSDSGKLHSFKPSQYETFYDELKNSEGTFHVASIPVMVLVYNNEVVKVEDAPKTFLSLGEVRFKDKITGGSPLASGTNFTTVAALQKKYGWDYFQKLKANNFLFEGGNSAVVKRIQNKEKPIGWVLLENILRFQNEDKRLQVIYPEDGVITQFNTLAIVKKSSPRDVEQKIADWIFTEVGQNAMIGSYMYSPIKGFKSPVGAPEFSTIKGKAFAWTNELIKEITLKRSDLKEEFSNIVFK